ncbi:protein MCM10 homolog [Tubulanus polymorphus]|uniref:protein MCM10 homolog n=1 Tax=Tubulanus polymorphus TaxID=672921 RepID=UPI003DA48300
MDEPAMTTATSASDMIGEDDIDAFLAADSDDEDEALDHLVSLNEPCENDEIPKVDEKIKSQREMELEAHVKAMEERMARMEAMIMQQSQLSQQPTPVTQTSSKPTAASTAHLNSIQDNQPKHSGHKIKSVEVKENPTRQLKDLNEDIFASATPSTSFDSGGKKSNLKVNNKKLQSYLNKEKSLVHEDSEELSDWDDLDGEKPTYSTEGQEIHKIISKKGQNRVAHTPKPEHTDSQKKRPPSTNSASTSNKHRLQKSPTDTKTKSAVPAKKEDSTSFSGINVYNPKVSSLTWKNRITNKNIITASKLPRLIGTSATQDSWILMAVIVGKMEPRQSSKGNTYSLWKLSDLVNCETVITCFLFKNSHKDLWKESLGTVVALLNPERMQNESNDSKYKNSSELSVSIDNSQKVMVLGASRDYGICTSVTKAGKKCNNFINKVKGDKCSYHVQSAYKKASAKRGELQAASGTTPRSFENKLGLKKGNMFFYGGQSYTSESFKAQKKSEKVTLDDIKKMEKRPKHKLQSDDEERLKKLDSRSQLQEMLIQQSVGSINLKKSLEKEEKIKEELKKGPEKSEVITFQKFKKMIRNGAHKRKKSGGGLDEVDGCIDLFDTTSSSVPTQNEGLPQLGRGLCPGQEFSLDVLSTKKSRAVSKVEAAARLKSKGSVIKKKNPNAVKRKLSEEEQERIKKIAIESNQSKPSGEESSERTQQNEPVAKKSRILQDKNSNMDSKEMIRLLKAGSSHKDSVTQAQLDQEDKYFSALEKKEQYEEKMESIMSISVKTYTCNQCNYTAEKPAEHCKTQGHNVRQSKGKKQFFKCRDCGFRVTTLDRYPHGTCLACGKSAFVHTSMKWDRKGPQLDSEKLQITNEDSKNLNQL